MTLRLISPGLGERRDVVVVHHLDPAATTIQGRVRAAAGQAIVVNDTSATQGHYLTPQHLSAVVEWARASANALATGRVILVGFSAGCQALRAHLLAGESPDAVVAADGTHASLPPIDATQIKPWRDYAALARGGRAVLIASHTAIVPPTFLSTRRTLEAITGWPLDAHEGRTQAGKLVVYSWPGADAADHREQAQVALPRMLGEAMLMMAPTASTPPTPPIAPPVPRPSFGAAVVAAAEADLAAMPREIRHNDGPWIREVLKRFGLAAPNNYCAAGVSHWLAVAAAATHRPSPIPGSAGAKTLMAQFKAAGMWLPASKASATTVRPGSVPIWHRGPPGAWTGHTGVVVQCVGGSFYTIEANGPAPSDFAVAMTERKFADRELLGFGVFDG